LPIVVTPHWLSTQEAAGDIHTEPCTVANVLNQLKMKAVSFIKAQNGREQEGLTRRLTIRVPF
jgi:hypothetical protein